jgi:serine/threonine protein kinase
MSSSGQRTPFKLLTVGDLDPQTDPAIEDDFIGRVIAGRYTVRAHIGGGGMADVFYATDEELGIDVVIKLLKPFMASDELRARMVQEARAAAQIRHANLVRVFGTGRLDNTAYIVMELLGGPNLDQYVREYQDQRIPWREALGLLLPALEALHAIHERGYVHRDIKPGNILVTREPGHAPTAIVIDLGLVKPDRALRTVDSPPTTEVGRMLCTPGYTSPEQALGRPVDRRSDVYSMGITLYRVLTGRLPFHEVHGRHVAAVLARHIYNEPTLLADAAATAEIPPAVAEVVESALRKDPAQRPQTMLEFAEALRAAATSAAPGAMPRRRRPHELLLALGLGVVITLLALPRPASLPAASLASNQVQASGLVTTHGPDELRQPTTAGLASAVSGSSSTTEPRHPTIAVGSAGETGSRAAVPLADASTTAGEAKPTSPEPSMWRRDPKAAWHRALELRTADVQRCADQATGSIERLAVVVNIDRAGRVSAHVEGADNNPLSRCLDVTLKHTPLASPREPTSFVHIFKLRTTPRP